MKCTNLKVSVERNQQRYDNIINGSFFIIITSSRSPSEQQPPLVGSTVAPSLLRRKHNATKCPFSDSAKELLLPQSPQRLVCIITGKRRFRCRRRTRTRALDLQKSALRWVNLMRPKSKCDFCSWIFWLAYINLSIKSFPHYAGSFDFIIHRQ